MVTSVCATPGTWRICAASRSAMSRVSTRLVPSGARMFTSNSAMSLGGVKLLGTAAASGAQEPSVTQQATTMIQRCFMKKRRIAM